MSFIGGELFKNVPYKDGLEMTSQYSEKNQTALKKLDILVDELAEKCSYAPAGFGKPGIRQHSLDTLNELRRRVHKGHDFNKVLAECLLCI